MRLFSIGKTNDLKQAQQREKLLEAKKADELRFKLSKGFQDYKEQVKIERDLITAQFNKFREATRQERDELLGEVKMLEDRKLKALEPIGKIREQAENRIIELDSQEREIHKQKRQYDKLAKKALELENKNQQTERKLKDSVIKFKEKVKELDARAKRVVSQEEALNKQKEEYEAFIIKENKRFSDMEKDFKNRERVIMTAQEELKRERERLANESKLIESQRESLIALNNLKK